MPYQVPKMTLSKPNKLRYLTIRNNTNFNKNSISLNPKNSDIADNQTILNSLIGTLVKFGKSGKIEPYIANKWYVSDDQKTWTFYINSNFSCENGEPINASSFKEKIIKNLKRNISKTDKTEFTDLKGWREFKENNIETILGIKAIENKLIFTFEKNPKGILNYLRMPYFGFWCDNNFENDQFIDNNQFYSSGPYKLAKVISNNRLLLEIRPNQPSYNKDAPQFIEIGLGSLEELSEKSDNTIGKIIIESENLEIKNYEIIDGTPSIMQGIVLHEKTVFFNSIENRKVFAKRLFDYQKINSQLNFTKGFYFNQNIDKKKVENFPTIFLNPPKKIRIALQYDFSFDKTKQIWNDIFNYIFDGIDFEIVYPKNDDPNWIKGILNSSEYHLRTSSVYPGGQHSLSVLRMMFCSNLGISFPDPSLRLCQLIDTYISNNKEVDGEFISLFDKILIEDATVFPLFYAKDRWFVSDSIDLESMPTTIIHPLFEKIRFK